MEILNNFYNAIILSQEIIITTVFLVLILVIALLIGWNSNRSRPYTLEMMLRWLNEKYEKNEIQKKEYTDVKDVLEKSFNQINYYLKSYSKRK